MTQFKIKIRKNRKILTKKQDEDELIGTSMMQKVYKIRETVINTQDALQCKASYTSYNFYCINWT